MKRLIMALAIVLCFATFSYADHYVRTGVFDPGFYICCEVFENTPVTCYFILATGSVDETQENVDYLNENLDVATGIDIRWWHWDSGYWIKYKLPWKLIEGDRM